MSGNDQRQSQARSSLASFGFGIVAGAAAAGIAYLATQLMDDDCTDESEDSASNAAAGASGSQRVNPPANIPAQQPSTSYREELVDGDLQNASQKDLRDKLIEEQERQLCVICKTNFKTVILYPCKHMCVCPECVEQLIDMPKSRQKCPVCRAQIEDTDAAYL